MLGGVFHCFQWLENLESSGAGVRCRLFLPILINPGVCACVSVAVCAASVCLRVFACVCRLACVRAFASASGRRGCLDVTVVPIGLCLRAPSSMFLGAQRSDWRCYARVRFADSFVRSFSVHSFIHCGIRSLSQSMFAHSFTHCRTRSLAH